MWQGIFLPESAFSVARDFSPRVSFQCRLVQCLYSPHVQSHALTSVCTLKIPSIGSHTSVWTHKNTACTVRNGWWCSCSCCSLTQGRRPEFPARDAWSNKIKKWNENDLQNAFIILTLSDASVRVMCELNWSSHVTIVLSVEVFAAVWCRVLTSPYAMCASLTQPVTLMPWRAWGR